MLRGGVGYLTALLPLPEPVLIVALGVGLTLVALKGVVESMAVAALFTVIEILGLLAVAAAEKTKAQALLITLADMPFIAAAHIDALIADLKAAG